MSVCVCAPHVYMFANHAFLMSCSRPYVLSCLVIPHHVVHRVKLPSSCFAYALESYCGTRPKFHHCWTAPRLTGRCSSSHLAFCSAGVAEQGVQIQGFLLRLEVSKFQRLVLVRGSELSLFDSGKLLGSLFSQLTSLGHQPGCG